MRTWQDKPEVSKWYFKKVVDYEKAYNHLYEEVSFMLLDHEDEKVRVKLLREWDRLRRDMP